MKTAMKTTLKTAMNGREAGYTLLEMLVALAVFGLIMAGIAQGYRFGLTAWSAGSREIIMPERMAAMDAALDRLIEAAQPGSMVGDAHGLAFTTRLPEAAGIAGLADVALLREKNGTLVLRYRAHAPGIALTPPTAPHTEELARNTAGLDIAYLAPVQNAAPRWVAAWSGPALPLLLRLHVTLKDGQTWPDLIAAPADRPAPPPGTVPAN